MDEAKQQEMTCRVNAIPNGNDFTDPVEVNLHRKILNRLLDEVYPITT